MKRLLVGEHPHKHSGGSTSFARFLRACRVIGAITNPDVLWGATNAEQLALVKTAWTQLHRVLNGGKTIPDNLYRKGKTLRRD